MLLALEYENLSVCIAKINLNAYGICTSGVCMIACALGFTQKDAAGGSHICGVTVAGYVKGVRLGLPRCIGEA